MEGKGVSWADAERIVEPNLTKITKKLYETSQTSCNCSQVNSAGMTAAALDINSHRYISQ